MRFIIASMVFGLSGLALASQLPEQPTGAKMRYKAGSTVNFEQLIIEGQLKRPELSVITGDDEEGYNGLLRLRENFNDRMIVDAGEEIP